MSRYREDTCFLVSSRVLIIVPRNRYQDGNIQNQIWCVNIGEYVFFGSIVASYYHSPSVNGRRTSFGAKETASLRCGQHPCIRRCRLDSRDRVGGVGLTDRDRTTGIG